MQQQQLAQIDNHLAAKLAGISPGRQRFVNNGQTARPIAVQPGLGQRYHGGIRGNAQHPLRQLQTNHGVRRCYQLIKQALSIPQAASSLGGD